MSNVAAIGTKGITPRLVLETLHDEIENIEDLYVVAFPKSGGHRLYASGSLVRLPLAALLIQELALDYVNDRIKDG